MTCNFCVIIPNGFLKLEYSYKNFYFNIRVAKKVCSRSVDRFYIKRYVKKKISLLNLEYLNMLFLIELVCFFDYFMLKFL